MCYDSTLKIFLAAIMKSFNSKILQLNVNLQHNYQLFWKCWNNFSNEADWLLTGRVFNWKFTRQSGASKPHTNLGIIHLL